LTNPLLKTKSRSLKNVKPGVLVFLKQRIHNTQHTFTTYPGLGKINRLGLSIFVPKNTFTRFMDLSFGSSSNIIYN